MFEHCLFTDFSVYNKMIQTKVSYPNYKLAKQPCGTDNFGHSLGRCAVYAPKPVFDNTKDAIATRISIDWRYGDQIPVDQRINYRVAISTALYDKKFHRMNREFILNEFSRFKSVSVEKSRASINQLKQYMIDYSVASFMDKIRMPMPVLLMIDSSAMCTMDIVYLIGELFREYDPESHPPIRFYLVSSIITKNELFYKLISKDSKYDRMKSKISPYKEIFWDGFHRDLNRINSELHNLDKKFKFCNIDVLQVPFDIDDKWLTYHEKGVTQQRLKTLRCHKDPWFQSDRNAANDAAQASVLREVMGETRVTGILITDDQNLCHTAGITYAFSLRSNLEYLNNTIYSFDHKEINGIYRRFTDVTNTMSERHKYPRAPILSAVPVAHSQVPAVPVVHSQVPAAPVVHAPIVPDVPVSSDPPPEVPPISTDLMVPVDFNPPTIGFMGARRSLNFLQFGQGLMELGRISSTHPPPVLDDDSLEPPSKRSRNE